MKKYIRNLLTDRGIELVAVQEFQYLTTALLSTLFYENVLISSLNSENLL